MEASEMNLADGEYTVSYTHLDVYKRQESVRRSGKRTGRFCILKAGR